VAAAEALQQCLRETEATNNRRLQLLMEEVDLSVVPITGGGGRGGGGGDGGGGGGGGGDGGGGGSEDSDDDDEDYSPDDDDSEGEEEEEEGLDVPPKRRRMKAKPASDSVLGKRLLDLKDSILKDTNLLKGQQWWYPTSSPLSTLSINPKDWCEPLVFAFVPFRQFSALVGTSPAGNPDLCCVKCKQGGCLTSKGYYYRAMHHATGEIVWCLHRRLKCKECNGTFAEIDPRFLAQLPTPVVEAFPFITSSKGPGIHQVLLLQFNYLATKGIMYGTYTNMVNELKRFGHSAIHARYLNILENRVDQAQHSQLQTIVPEVFPPYQSSGEYHGMDLEPRILKKHFIQRQEVDEDYHQRSFQTASDIAGSSDLTYKTAKKVSASGRKGQVFEASLTKDALNGKMEISQFMHTETNEEIEPLIYKYKEVRINAGQTQYLRHECDEGGDRHLWSKVFEELKAITPYKPSRVNGLMRATMKKGTYRVLNSKQEADDWASAVVSKIAAKNVDGIFFGFDAEWNYKDGTNHLTRTIQISFPEDVAAQTVVIHLSKMGAFTAASFPAVLKNLLELPQLTAVGVKVSGDVDRLGALGVRVKNFVDVGELAKGHVSNAPKGYGMQALAARYLELHVDKQLQDADWKQDPLPVEQVEYAALDAILSLQLYLKISPLVVSMGNLESQSFAIETDEVELMFYNTICAKVSVMFVGREGNQQKWGRLTVGKGKSIVRLTKILDASSKPPFSFDPDEIDLQQNKNAWNKKDRTLKQLLDAGITDIAVPTSRLRKQLPQTLLSDFITLTAITATTAAPTTAALAAPAAPAAAPAAPAAPAADAGTAAAATTAAAGTAAPAAHAGTAAAAAPAAAPAAPAAHAGTAAPAAAPADTANPSNTAAEDYFESIFNSSEGVEEEEDLPRSRDKSDIFHIFQNLPLKRRSPVRPLLSRLLIHATFYFDQEDFDKVAKYLAEKKYILTTEMLLRDFYHNRYWWRRRVKMYTPSAEEHAIRIALVHKIVQTEEVFKDDYTHELAQYLYGFEEKARKGMFEELADVSLYTWDGTDSNGLDLWLSNRGSTRTENFHQKLMTALGPYSVGAQTAHYIMLLVTFRYNVKTGIRRSNEHNFGHPYLQYIDRIQSSYLKLLGVDVFPRHMNLEDFAAVKDYYPVGIGKLHYSGDFVEQGPPHPNLKGDLKFMSERQGLVCSPRYVQHKKEYEIFNDFMETHPHPSSKDWIELAKLYKQKSDYVDIFPKLPSMLKTYHKRWRDSQSVVMAEMKVKGAYNALLFGLALPVSSAIIPGARVQEHLHFLKDSNQEQTAVDVQQQQLEKQSQPVQPLAAPAQKQFVSQFSVTHVNKRKCCNAVFGCNEFAEDCGGFIPEACRTFLEGRIQLPSKEKQKEERKKERRKRKREAEAERKQRKKKEKEQEKNKNNT